MSALNKRNHFAMAVAMALLLAMCLGAISLWIKQSKELEIAREKHIADSLLLTQYQREKQRLQELEEQYKTAEHDLQEALQKYGKGGFSLNGEKKPGKYIESLFKAYENQNKTLQNKIADREHEVAALANDIKEIKNRKIYVENKLSDLQSILNVEKNALDSVSREYKKLQSRLSESIIDTLTIYSPNGMKILYYGKTHNQAPAGIGVGFYEGKGHYIGEWKGNLRHGWGKHTFKDGSIYEGYFENDLRNGLGTYYYASGETYTGYWKDDLMNGKGKITNANGKTVNGVWESGKLKTSER